MHHSHSTPVYVGSKVVGYVESDTFTKIIRGSKHLLRQPPAIAFDISTLYQAEAAGAVKVKVIDRDSGITYRAEISHIREKGIQFNRGYGDQVALPLNGWIISKRGGGLQLHLWR